MDTLFPKLLLIVESCFALFLGGLGIYLIIFALHNRLDDKESRSWSKSQGVIIDNEIITELMPRGRMSYIPVVKYIFLANHRMIQGRKICVGRPHQFPRQKKAQQLLGNYLPGCKVNVFFDPHNPEEAVLEPCIYDRKQCLVLGTIFILLMILVLSLIAVWWSNEKSMVIDQLYKSLWVGKIFGWKHLLKKVTLPHFTCYLSARV